jgi:hypothetical protein
MEEEYDRVLAADPRTVIHGYCFYHQQDTEGAVEAGNLFLAYDSVTNDTKDQLAIGREVADAMTRHGRELHVERLSRRPHRAQAHVAATGPSGTLVRRVSWAARAIRPELLSGYAPPMWIQPLTLRGTTARLEPLEIRHAP